LTANQAAATLLVITAGKTHDRTGHLKWWYTCPTAEHFELDNKEPEK